MLINTTGCKMSAIALQETVPSKTLKRIATYVQPELFEDLEKLGAIENRTLSNLLATLAQQAVDSAKREGKLSDRTNTNPNN